VYISLPYVFHSRNLKRNAEIPPRTIKLIKKRKGLPVFPEKRLVKMMNIGIKAIMNKTVLKNILAAFTLNSISVLLSLVSRCIME
jgi:hypothetical protein